MKIEKHDWMIGLGVLLIVVGMALLFMPSPSTLTAPGTFAKETAETAAATSVVSSGGGFGGAGQCLAEGGGGFLEEDVEEYEEF